MYERMAMRSRVFPTRKKEFDHEAGGGIYEKMLLGGAKARVRFINNPKTGLGRLRPVLGFKIELSGLEKIPRPVLGPRSFPI